MAVVTNIKYGQGVVIHEYAYKGYCRDTVVLEQSATVYPAGQMIGIITANSKGAIYDSTAGDGTETFVGVLTQAVDATAGDVSATMIVRGPAVLNQSALKGHADQADLDSVVADLKALTPPIFVQGEV